MIKTIIFDFDGVILDSMSMRRDGFWEIFKEHGEEAFEKFVPYHMNNGGISRFVKVRYFYEQILGKSISEEKIKELTDEFTNIMRKSLTDSSFLMHDSVDFIKQNHKIYPLHIASGAEENELRFLCNSHNLSGYFVSIHGSPTPKEQVIANILKTHSYNPSECAMIGDAINDFNAASANGVPFYGYNNEELKSVSAQYIDSFKEFGF